jgi:GTP-binding protein
MKKILFNKATFLISSMDKFPNHFKNDNGKVLDEIAIVGRSNVGKSSLINHLLNNKQLAKVSSSPGKTQTINFFNIDDELIITDLPGYGFAKVDKTKKDMWKSCIENYLLNRTPLKLILLLLDSRRDDISDKDFIFLSWASHYQIPLLVIFTKTDKDKQTISDKKIQKITSEYKIQNFLSYSIKEKNCKINLINKINSYL